MRNNILITSKINHHKKNYRYLHYGCADIQSNIIEKNLIFDHPWRNPKNYKRDSARIKKIYNILLKQITSILNNYHNIFRDKRFWSIYIGTWLHTFLVAYYEKYILIKKLKKYKNKITVQVFETKTKKQIPSDFLSFLNDHLNSFEWHDYLFSEILTKQNLSKNIILKKKIKRKNRNNLSKLFFQLFSKIRFIKLYL